MTANPLLDTVQSGTTTYDILSREIKNSNTATGAATNLKVWLGTSAQYTAIVTKDSSTAYVLTNSPDQQTRVIFRRF